MFLFCARIRVMLLIGSIFDEENCLYYAGASGVLREAFASFYWGDFKPFGDGLGYVVEAVADAEISAGE